MGFEAANHHPLAELAEEVRAAESEIRRLVSQLLPEAAKGIFPQEPGFSLDLLGRP